MTALESEPIILNRNEVKNRKLGKSYIRKSSFFKHYYHLLQYLHVNNVL